MKFQVELVWTGEDDGTPASVYLTADGRIVLQGRAVPLDERKAMGLDDDVHLVSIDRAQLAALKEML